MCSVINRSGWFCFSILLITASKLQPLLKNTAKRRPLQLLHESRHGPSLQGGINARKVCCFGSWPPATDSSSASLPCPAVFSSLHHGAGVMCTGLSCQYQTWMICSVSHAHPVLQHTSHGIAESAKPPCLRFLHWQQGGADATAPENQHQR